MLTLGVKLELVLFAYFLVRPRLQMGLHNAFAPAYKSREHSVGPGIAPYSIPG